MNMFTHFPSSKTTLNIRQRLAYNFITALNTDDWDLLRLLLTDEVTWNFPGKSLLSGKAFGVEAIIERAQLFTRFDASLHLQQIFYGVTEVAVQLQAAGKRGKLFLDEHVVFICSVENDKIIAIDSLISDEEMVDDFFTDMI